MQAYDVVLGAILVFVITNTCMIGYGLSRVSELEDRMSVLLAALGRDVASETELTAPASPR